MSKSVLISFRLHPALYDDEARAHDVYERAKADGHDARKIMTAALLNLDGQKVRTTGTQRDVMAMLHRLEAKLDAQTQLIEALQSMDLSQYIGSTGRTLAQDLGDTLSDDVLHNIFTSVQGKSFDVD